MKVDLNTALASIKGIIFVVLEFVLAVLMLATVLRVAGHAVPYVAAPDPTQLGWLAGAWYAIRKA